MDLDSLEHRLLHPPVDLSALSPQEQFALIREKAAPGNSIVTEAALLERLEECRARGRPLRVKFGIDPTGPQIHIGHAVPLLNLRRLWRMGHEIHLIIGDFTAMVGDPGGRMDARPPLNPEQVRENMATYAAQASRVLDLQAPRVKLHYNSLWLQSLSLARWLSTTKGVTVSSLLQREDFRRRLEQGRPLSLAEFEYALLMGYDSVELKPDLEVGGMDQFLNFHFCRAMMEQAGQRPEVFVCFDLLPGTSGERDAQGRLCKMSKSRGNYIPVEAAPAEMYGKVMSIPDEVMWIWFRELTEIRQAELDELRAEVEKGRVHPKQAKHLLARVVVATFHAREPGAVEAAERDFNSKFGKQAQKIPEGVSPVRLPRDPMELGKLLARAAGQSVSQARRVMEQKGLQIFEPASGEWKPLTAELFQAPAAHFAGRHLRWGRRFFQIVEEG